MVKTAAATPATWPATAAVGLHPNRIWRRFGVPAAQDLSVRPGVIFVAETPIWPPSLPEKWSTEESTTLGNSDELAGTDVVAG